jgi:hypothetical protein
VKLRLWQQPKRDAIFQAPPMSPTHTDMYLIHWTT